MPSSSSARPQDSSPSEASRFPVRRVLLAWAAGFAVAAVYAAIRFVPLAGWTVHDVTTGETAQYPDLQPRVYNAAPDNATVVAAAVASRVLGWHVLKTDVPGHTVTAEARDLLGLRTDDVLIQVAPAGPDGSASRVTIRSQSRLGIGDLGANARHIRDLQAGMDDKLPPVTP